jgi:hypothetical protein
MAKLKSSCCGAPIIEGGQCAACGADAGDRPLENIIRRVVEDHDSLCLDVKAERETLISALWNELAGEYAALQDEL